MNNTRPNAKPPNAGVEVLLQVQLERGLPPAYWRRNFTFVRARADSG
jgi:hypothetical protein